MIYNLLLDIPFWMHNNLNMIIKICINIYLLCVVLFPSSSPEGMPTFLLVYISIMSIGSTKLYFAPPPKKMAKGVQSKSPFLNDY